jgi:hypothetical protein
MGTFYDLQSRTRFEMQNDLVLPQDAPTFPKVPDVKQLMTNKYINIEPDFFKKLNFGNKPEIVNDI